MHQHAPVRRRPVPRVARALRATPTPRAIPRRRRAILCPRRSSPRRRAVGFARVVPRAWRVGVESKRRARLARDSRDARAIRDSRPTDGSSRARRVRARRRSRRGRGRASSCAASRASRHASRSRRPTATDRPRVLTVYAYETVAPRRVISLFAHTRWPPARSDDTRHPLDARAATAVDDDDDDDDARAARAGVRDRRRDGGVESARARDARTHRTTRADARGDSDPHRVLRKVKLHASGEDVHR